MQDYKTMYYHLFCRTQDAIELLQKAQCECEELMMSAPEDTQNAGED